MEQEVKPTALIEPLPPEHTPELKESFEAMKKIEIGEKYLAAHGWRVGKHAR